jgi:hypothetical protein
MSSSATPLIPKERLAEIFEELAELSGQRNAIDGQIVDLVAEIEHDNLCGMTGCRSVAALVAWKTGVSPSNAATIATIAHRLEQFPRLAAGMREGWLSADRVGVIAERAADGSDEHYVELAKVATVTQLRTAVKLEPRPDPDPRPERPASISKTVEEKYTTYKVRLARLDAAKFDAALQSHRDALYAQWKRDRDGDGGGEDGEDPGKGDHTGEDDGAGRPPMPTMVDAFMGLVEAGWDTEVARRPHGQRTTVVMHFDVKDKVGSLHLGPLLTDADRQYMTCDATCEAWFERDGQPIGSGRSTRQISRRLRRALEHRHPTCAVPGCGATRGLHAHHIRHWEDGGATELDNLVLLCSYHHRLHHRGVITITGPADRLVVTDSDGEEMSPGSLARPPTTPPPDVPPCPGPYGERADWWWYTPFEPQPPPSEN